MRSGLRPISFVFGALTGVALSFTLIPLWKLAVETVNQDQFGELTYKCDNSMRVHFLAKHKLASNPTTTNVQDVKSAEIGLLDCQAYDLERKRLKRWGLSDNELSEMSLKAVEQKGSDLRDVIRIHEIRY
jgi:hypothetical protein